MEEQSCLGNYGVKDGCDSCVAVLLCIDVTLELDGYFDQLYDRQKEIEEMEADYAWHEWQ